MTEHQYACLESKAGKPVVLLGVRIAGDLKGLLFEASVEQIFRNPTDQNIEVVYTFPLPWGAVLMGVDVELGRLHLTGAVVEKRESEAKYEEALSEGNAAIMLEKNHDHSYTLNLGNLAAQENCVITLRYAQTLQFEQRGLRVLIPTVIAPRYGDAVADGGLQPHQATTHDMLAEYPFEIALRLHGDLARARVASPSHPVAVAQTASEQGGALTVTLGRRGALDRDFVLVIDQLLHESASAFARDSVEPDSIASLVSFCPRVVATEGSTKIAVKILVDCSGSMNGDSLDAAKRSLQGVVRRLVKGDRFSLSRFGSHVEHRSRGLWTASETTRLAAQRWVGDLAADMGGTEMAKALSSTFALAQTVPSDVLLVTDGEISAIDHTIGIAKASGHRLFVVGIGSSAAESHLRRLAEATGGACDFVAPGEAVEPAVLRMFARLRSPRLNDIAVVWPEGMEPQWVSKIPPSIFDGDTVNVFALLKQPPVGIIRLEGRGLDGQMKAEIASVACSDLEVESGATLSRMAASFRLHTEFPSGQTAPDANALRLALDYQLVTDRTNFLLVRERSDVDEAKDMPELHKVNQMLAAGWAGAGSVVKGNHQSVFESRTIAYSQSTTLDWGDQGTPVVASLPNRRDVKFCMNDDHDAPLFSRSLKWDDVNESSPSFGAKVHKGMTPLALSEWLRAQPLNGWPTTYSALKAIGLGGEVIDWLELSVAAHGDATASESEVIQAFLYVMSRRSTHELLANSSSLVAHIKAFAQRLRDGMKGETQASLLPNVRAALIDRIVSDLSGVTAFAWPDTIFSATSSPGKDIQETERPATGYRF